jgi:hypothetical protein
MMMMNYQANMPVYRFGVPQWSPIPGYMAMAVMPPMQPAQ